jgi:hypothetical protein
MIHSQNDRVIGDLSAAAVGSTATSTLVIDTLGYDHASITVMRASNASTAFANALKVEESDASGSGYSDVTGLVLGAVNGFTVPAISAAGTAVTSVVKLDVDTKARKRYLRVAYTPGASANIAITGRLSRAETSPENASQAGSLAWVRG